MAAKDNPLYQNGITALCAQCDIPVDPELSNPIRKERGWTYDKETGRQIIVDVGETDIQALVDSYAGMDMRSIINRQQGDTPMEKLQSAVDKGLLTPEPVPTEDTDLTLAPKSRFEGERLARSVKQTTAEINGELGTDFTAAEIVDGAAQKAIDAYIQKRIDEAIKAQGGAINGESKQ